MRAGGPFFPLWGDGEGVNSRRRTYHTTLLVPIYFAIACQLSLYLCTYLLPLSSSNCPLVMQGPRRGRQGLPNINLSQLGRYSVYLAGTSCTILVQTHRNITRTCIDVSLYIFGLREGVPTYVYIVISELYTCKYLQYRALCKSRWLISTLLTRYSSYLSGFSFPTVLWLISNSKAVLKLLW